MKKLVFSLIFVNFIAINYNSFLFSEVIDQNSINPNKVKIKVAALFSKDSLKLALKDFKDYQIYLEYKNNFVRFFIVNIPKDMLTELLKKVRVGFPDAFIYKKIINRNSNCLLNKKSVDKTITNSKSKFKKNINFLNSDTILQTRKKFY